MMIVRSTPSVLPTPPATPGGVSPSTVYGPRSDGGTNTAPSGAVVVASGGNVPAAITAAGANGTVFLSNGSYTTGDWVPLSGQTILGESQAGVILSSASGNHYLVAPNSANNVTLQSFTMQNYNLSNPYVEGTISSHGGTGWHLQYITAKNCSRAFEHTGCDYIEDCYIQGGANTNQGIGTGPTAGQSPTGIIRYCEIWDCGANSDGNQAGIKTLFCNGATITNNYIHNNYSFGIWSDTSQGSVDDTAHHAVDIYNNKCWHNGASGIFYETSRTSTIWYNDCQFNGDGSNGHGTAAITGGFFSGSCQIYIGDSHNVDVAHNTAGNGPGSIGCADNHAGDSSGNNMMYNVQVHDNTIISGDAGMQVLGSRDPNAYSTSAFRNNTYSSPITFWWSSGPTSSYTADPSGGGGGGGVGGAAARTTDELYGCVYGGRPDYLTGGNVPYYPGTSGPYAAHDVTPLPGLGASGFDWAPGATKQTWPTDGSWSGEPYINAWNHAFLNSAQRNAYFDFTDPTIYYGSSAQGYPSPNTAIWTSWIAPFFTFKGDAVTETRSTTSGGTAFWSVDMSTSTAANGYFVHCAWDYYDSRIYVPPGTVVSIQWWARMRPKTGVDPSTVVMLAGGAGDRYFSATDPGGGANPAIGIPRYKRLPTDSSWRLMGYTTQTPAALLASPPSIIAAPL